MSPSDHATQPTWALRPRLLGLSIVAALLFCLGGGPVSAEQGDSGPVPLEANALYAHADDGIQWWPAASMPATDRSPATLARGGAAPAWQAKPIDGWQLIDDFESIAWPRVTDWPLVADLNAPFVARIGYPWATSPCESEPGTRALRAVGGGEGATLDCNAAYPSAVASSALLSLDLARLSVAREAALQFDLWVEADPDEGLIVQLLRFADDGAISERRVIYSATGRVSQWARKQSIDLTNLRDARDPAWRHDLRGERAFLEFLFVSTDGGDGGARGVLLDDLGLDLTLAAPTTTPTPGATATPIPPTPSAPVNRTNLCSDIRNCHTLSVRAWVDRGCDGRNQVGHDSPLRGEPRIDVLVGMGGAQERLGTTLSSSGRATFAFPPSDAVAATLQLPDGYEMCPRSDNPASVTSDDFNRYGRAALNFRVARVR